MLKRYQQNMGSLIRICDALIIGALWLISYWLRFHLPIIEVTKGFPPFQTYASLLPLVMGIWMIVFTSMRVYQPKKMLRRTEEAFLVLRAHFVAMLLFISLTYLFSEYRYSRVVMAYFGLFSAFALIYAHVGIRNLARAFRKKSAHKENILIIGNNPLVIRVLEKVSQFPELGLNISGYLTLTGREGALFNHPVLGTYSQITQVIQSHGIHQVLIALPATEQNQMESILQLIKDEMIDVRILPDLNRFIALGCEVENFDNLPILNLNDSPLDGWSVFLKRLTDILFSLFALIILSPVLLLIAILIKLTSKGPVFYQQERLGLDGSRFPMWKFRSMKVDAEKNTGAVWAQKGDDRRTVIGKVLRQTSLDELPQFWNVLLGHMSLVGPRPERPVFVDQFKNEIPHYMLRHKVKAGITGWAQINGLRGDTSLTKRIEFDLYYIQNWSYLFDIKILFLTVWKGFINKNAY